MASDVQLKAGESVKVLAPSGQTLRTAPTATAITITATGTTTQPPVEPPVQPPTSSGKMAITRQMVDALPKSGSAYNAVLAASKRSDRPDLSNQEGLGNTASLARGLLKDKTGVVSDLKAARASLTKVQRTLSLARELQCLPLAADLAGVTDTDVGFDIGKFFMDAINKTGIEGRDADSVRKAASIDPTNWGCHARASVMWVAWYLREEDKVLLAEAWDDLKRYLEGGSRGFTYHSDQVSWGRWTIAPKGTTKNGVDLDGAIHDIYRGGDFPTVGAAGQNYVWEASVRARSVRPSPPTCAGMATSWSLGDKALDR